MEKVYFLHKFFWALIFIFIDINLGYFDIMHDSIGWILLLQGLNKLKNFLPVKRRIDTLVIFFVIVSVITTFTSSSSNIEIVTLTSLVSTFFTFYLYYELFQLLFVISKERNLTDKTKFHFYFMIVNFSFSLIYQNANLIYIDNFVNPGIIALIIISFSWMIGLLIHIHDLKKALSKPVVDLTV